ncbi:MAG: VOC family protein [Acidobacteriota bacterium]|jgi:lactoylglutathione lyase
MKLAHTMIRVRDLERTLDFYENLIGLHEVGRKAIGSEATLVFLTDAEGHYQVELTANHDGREYQRGDQFGHLAFHTEDLEAAIAAVERRGLPYRRSRPELASRYIFIQDPDGYDIEILER